MSQKNPIEEYFAEKTAGLFWQGIGEGARQGFGTPGRRGFELGKRMISGAGGAAAAAAGAGAVAGGVFGAQKLYDAATKARDFRAMLAADPRVAHMHQEDPRRVNQMFSTLRTMNPAFTRDPVVASSYVHKMVEDPSLAGGVAVDALQFRDKTKSPLADQVTRAAFHRAEKGR
jgi:hypothetical protein